MAPKTLVRKIIIETTNKHLVSNRLVLIIFQFVQLAIMPSSVEFFSSPGLTLGLLPSPSSLVAMLLLFVPGLVAAPAGVTVARPTARNSLSLFVPLLSILPTSGSFPPLQVTFHNEAVLWLTTITLPDLHGSVLNQMRLLWMKHLTVQLLRCLTVAEVAVGPRILRLLFGGIHHKSYKGESPGPT